MSETAEKLKAAILELPMRERFEIMDALATSLPAPPSLYEEGTPEFDAELDRRLREHESGRDRSILAADFFWKLREQR